MKCMQPERVQHILCPVNALMLEQYESREYFIIGCSNERTDIMAANYRPLPWTVGKIKQVCPETEQQKAITHCTHRAHSCTNDRAVRSSLRSCHVTAVPLYFDTEPLKYIVL